MGVPVSTLAMSDAENAARDSPQGPHAPYASNPGDSSSHPASPSALPPYLHTENPVAFSVEALLPDYAFLCCQFLAQTRGTVVHISREQTHEFLRRCCHYIRRTARRKGTRAAILLIHQSPYTAPWWVDQKMALEARKGLASPADSDEEDAVQESAESVDREVLKIVLGGSRGVTRVRSALRGVLGEGDLEQI